MKGPDGGHNEAVYILDHFLFFVGRAVFLATTTDVSTLGYDNVKVDFVIPDHWKVTTTWDPLCLSCVINRFDCPKLPDLGGEIIGTNESEFMVCMNQIISRCEDLGIEPPIYS